MKRSYGRPPEGLRPISIEPHYYDYTEGSCLVSYGNTQVLCVATVDDGVPPHVRGTGQAWVTGEYSMLPRSSPERIRRERDKVGGRTHEIQRLIGRALRSVVEPKGWGEKTVILDCDVLRADGGTRTASITGAFISLALALRKVKKEGRIQGSAPFPIREYVSAVSVGIVDGVPVLDLDYSEDSTAETDMNLVMTSTGKIIEIQGTAEREPFSEEQFMNMLALGRKGCESLCLIQREILGPLTW
ncbi:MAG: ribonuclease PH [Bdellovibrionales bacterium]|nr:ribonuclease PH [Bdellovibrionales bacterium]